MTKVELQRVWRRLGIPADYGIARGLKLQREATRLVSIGRAADDGRIVRVTARTAVAWHRMRDAAAHDGLTLLSLSGFRSIRRQAEIIRRKLAAGQPVDVILRTVAAPGFSEHHTGRALDLGSPEHSTLEENFAETAEFRWLSRHASAFGFRLSYPRDNPHGIVYEPWHWCWQL